MEDVVVTYSMFACAFRDDRVAAHATKLACGQDEGKLTCWLGQQPATGISHGGPEVDAPIRSIGCGTNGERAVQGWSSVSQSRLLDLRWRSPATPWIRSRAALQARPTSFSDRGGDTGGSGHCTRSTTQRAGVVDLAWT